MIIPCYNGARFIGRAVRSAASQEGVGQVEIVVVDDCSTDDSLAVLRQLETEIPSMRVLSSETNGGPGVARNRALGAAAGAWIALLDADDAFAPGRLRRLIEAAEEAEVDIIADYLVHYDLEADAPAPAQDLPELPMRRLGLGDLVSPDPVTGLDLGLLQPVFRRHLVDKGFWRYRPGIRHGEDFDLYVRLFRNQVSFGLLGEAFYLFSTRIGAHTGRYSPGSVTQVDYRSIAAQSLALLDELRSHAAGLDESLLEGLQKRAQRALWQNRVYGWTALRKGSWARLLAWLGADQRNMVELAQIGLAKLVGQRGLPA
ncbi:MAG: glycosyltransferase family 2 protein [Thermaurantiacus sp.]